MPAPTTTLLPFWHARSQQRDSRLRILAKWRPSDQSSYNRHVQESRLIRLVVAYTAPTWAASGLSSTNSRKNVKTVIAGQKYFAIIIRPFRLLPLSGIAARLNVSCLLSRTVRGTLLRFLKDPLILRSQLREQRRFTRSHGIAQGRVALQFLVMWLTRAVYMCMCVCECAYRQYISYLYGALLLPVILTVPYRAPYLRIRRARCCRGLD